MEIQREGPGGEPGSAVPAFESPDREAVLWKIVSMMKKPMGRAQFIIVVLAVRIRAEGRMFHGILSPC